MKVTDVVPQKNNKDRVSIFVDGKYSFSLDCEDAFFLKIKIGTELSERDIEKCNLESNLSKAMKRAMDILSRKPITRLELTKKLRDKGFDDTIISVAIDELESMGYIDDRVYASMYVEYAKEKGYGEKKIQYELSVKGIDRFIIEDILSEYYSVDTEDLCRLIGNKYGRIDLTDFKAKQKVFRYLSSRGFDFSLINDGIRQYIREFSGGDNE